MIWQDIVITAGTLILSVALIPTVLGKQKPPLLSSLPIAIVLATFAVSFTTLGMVASGAGAALQSLTWVILVVQRLRQ